MLDIRYYVTTDGRQPFAEWFAGLELVARAKVTRSLARMEQGNLSNAKAIGAGILSNIGSTSDRGTECILGATATPW